MLKLTFTRLVLYHFSEFKKILNTLKHVLRNFLLIVKRNKGSLTSHYALIKGLLPQKLAHESLKADPINQLFTVKVQIQALDLL